MDTEGAPIVNTSTPGEPIIDAEPVASAHQAVTQAADSVDEATTKVAAAAEHAEPNTAAMLHELTATLHGVQSQLEVIGTAVTGLVAKSEQQAQQAVASASSAVPGAQEVTTDVTDKPPAKPKRKVKRIGRR